MEQVNKETIKELRAWARDNLLDKVVYHSEFEEGIRFTSTGIKEFLNQPHEHFNAKNEFLTKIDVAIPMSPVVYDAPDKNGNLNNHYYYLETKIDERPSYIVIRLTRHNNQYSLYSIVDRIKKR